MQENVTTTSFLSDMICCHSLQIVALKLISTVIFDTLADSRNNGFNLMMNDGKQQSTFLFHDYAQYPENRHEQGFHDL
ncbi:hypothetical protein OIU92_01105 [Escherichia coli]|nr:hypothetical protein [Escherichia coli]